MKTANSMNRGALPRSAGFVRVFSRFSFTFLDALMGTLPQAAGTGGA